MFNYQRTHRCGDLTEKEIAQTVVLSGWVHRRRDHGGLIFIDLRDRFGITQIVFDPKINSTSHEQASNLRSEWVISVQGKVVCRKPEMENIKISTGKIEVEASTLTILSSAKTPPFSIAEEELDVKEDLRLKFRYLDIRRGEITKNLVLRHKTMKIIRDFMDSNGFLEITTPILGKSTPEGARDYLVPSRIYPGNVYALPQSPQIFKQLLMVSGMDRYFQIAPCFRDEDLRADRQPEFTQIDLEVSFETPDTLMNLLELLVQTIFESTTDQKITPPFLRMSYKEALESYGTDRPDLRFGMPLVRIDDLALKSNFNVLQEELETGGVVKTLCVPQGSKLSRKEIDDLIIFAKQFGLQGLAWMKRQEDGMNSNIVKFFSQDLLEELIKRANIQIGDLLFIAAGPEAKVNQALDHLRRKLAKELHLINDCNQFLWIIDFPLFRWDADNNRLESEHHPFTSPHPEDFPLLDSNPLQARALAYDLVLNGYEIGGGSQRIHSSDLQKKIFSTLKLTKEDISHKFGFFVEALKYGTPPHLGFAFGLDRILMILTKTDNIRDVIAFPKTQKASDLMLQSPSTYIKRQLEELKLLPTQSHEINWM